MSTLNFARDIRIFSPIMGDNLGDVASQVAIVEGLPSMAVKPGLVEARAHLLEVCAHLLGDTTFQGSALELHAASVCCRAMRLAAAFAMEDLAAERQGRLQVLNGDQWRLVHRALLAGTAGQVPVIRRIGTFHPPKWVVDILQMTARLGEIGWGADEVHLAARCNAEPTQAEKRAAAEHTQRLISRKGGHLGMNPEAVLEAREWLNANRANVQAVPRPAGALAINGQVWIRMSPEYRSPSESLEVAEAKRQRELAAANATVLCGRGGSRPFVAHREILEILQENCSKAAEYARGGRSRTRCMAR
jgi:hypothetical protein